MKIPNCPDCKGLIMNRIKIILFYVGLLLIIGVISFFNLKEIQSKEVRISDFNCEDLKQFELDPHSFYCRYNYFEGKYYDDVKGGGICVLGKGDFIYEKKLAEELIKEKGC